VRTNEDQDDLEVSRVEHQQAARTWWQRFPDLTETIEEMLVDGDRVLLRTRSTGTLQTEWRGIQPNGEEISWDAWYVYRVQDGLVAEERLLMDLMGLFVKLGAIEPPGA
jgi:predicted ester cyclase